MPGSSSFIVSPWNSFHLSLRLKKPCFGETLRLFSRKLTGLFQVSKGGFALFQVTHCGWTLAIFVVVECGMGIQDD